MPPGGVNSNNGYVKLDYLIVYQMGSCVSESCEVVVIHTHIVYKESLVSTIASC